MARVAYAEAGNQGESGLAGVVYTIINRLADGRWGVSVEAVVDARHQFEPVMRAPGRTWRGLPPVSAVQEARVNTIVNLALQGRLPDLTGGARFFQNRAVVQQRADAGRVSPNLVGFGRATPTAQIGAHTFYAAAGKDGGGHSSATASLVRSPRGGIFFVNNASGLGSNPLTPNASVGLGPTSTNSQVGALVVPATSGSSQ
ncbi:MAG: cell wall hydrolase [Caulobacteraceae bacterium]